jgi:hypothetical protein
LRLVVRAVLGTIRFAAFGLGAMSTLAIAVSGIRALWDDLTDPKNPELFFLFVPLMIGCAWYYIVQVVVERSQAHEQALRRYRELYDELYAASAELRTAGEEILAAMTKGTRGEFLAAKFHWHRATARIREFPPEPGIQARADVTRRP